MIRFDPAMQTWTATWGHTEWIIRLNDGQLLAETLGPTGSQPPPPQPGHFLPPPVYARGECAVYTGDHEELVVWSLADWSSDGPRLHVALQAGDLRATLEYEILPDLDLVHRCTRLTNIGTAPVRLRRASSFAVALPASGDYTLMHLDGAWGHECSVVRTPVGQHEIVLQSRAGKTGFEHAPWFAMEGADGVWIGALLWSGNWEIHCRHGFQQPAGVTGGIQAFALRETLEPGAALDLPAAVYGYVPGDLNMAVQRLHDWQRRNRPDPDRPIPVHFNSWYPYQGEPDAAHVSQLIDHASFDGGGFRRASRSRGG